LPYTERPQLIRLAFERIERLTADGLWNRAIDVDQSNSRATVYRTVGLLRDYGLIQEFKAIGGERFYSPKTNAHNDPSYLICSDCEMVIKFQEDHMALLKDCISRRLGSKPSRKTMRIETMCAELRANGVCKRRKS
jgi:Fur family ferric uptake transcriptional regulator